MVIRQMTDTDVPQIGELEKLCFSDPWSEHSIAAELENPLSCWIVAEEEGNIVGYVGSQTVLDSADMMNIAVSPDSRRKGIGEKLISFLIEQIDKRGAKNLILEVRQSNEAAIGLYQKLGFAEMGVRRNYYKHPKENALIMGKKW